MVQTSNLLCSILIEIAPLFLLYLVYVSVSFHLVLAQSESGLFSCYKDALLFVSLSLVGSSDWSATSVRSMGSFLTVVMFAAGQFGYIAYITAVMVRWVVAENSVVRLLFRRVDGLLGLVGRRLASRTNLYYQRYEMDLKIKRFFPGLYYKVIRPRRKFERKVQEMSVSSTASRADVVSLSARSEPEMSATEKSIRTVRRATDEVLDRLHDVGSEVGNESQSLTARVTELRRVLVLLGTKLDA